MSTRTWVVYQHEAADGSLLYVGCTGNLRKRTAEHRRDTEWWPQVAAVRAIAEFDDRALALDYEAVRIMGDAPRFNRAHNERAAPPAGITAGLLDLVERRGAKVAARRRRHLEAKARWLA